jgi:hypothetical protein
LICVVEIAPSDVLRYCRYTASRSGDAGYPLRLGVAAALAFPDGSMAAARLRREADRGRLIIERIAGKDFTTLANIEG